MKYDFNLVENALRRESCGWLSACEGFLLVRMKMGHQGLSTQVKLHTGFQGRDSRSHVFLLGSEHILRDLVTDRGNSRFSVTSRG